MKNYPAYKDLMDNYRQRIEITHKPIYPTDVHFKMKQGY